jgi:mono/diheme cytochrome c family protein
MKIKYYIAMLYLALLSSCNNSTNVVQKEEVVDTLPKLIIVPTVGIDEDTYKRGRDIFKANCRCCHAFKDDLIAPQMAYNDEQYLFDYISNPDSLRKSGNKRALELKVKYPNNPMMPFTNVLSQKEICDVVEFINYRATNP